MKKLVLVLILVLVLVVVLPVSAARPVPVGDRINVLAGTPLDYPADTAFHIKHGWMFGPGDEVTGYPLGKFDFQLEVDGVMQEDDFLLRENDRSTRPISRTLLWVHNFPDGMTGTHTFTGTWLAPCRYAVDQGWFTDPCARPNAMVEFATIDHTVTFTFVP